VKKSYMLSILVICGYVDFLLGFQVIRLIYSNVLIRNDYEMLLALDDGNDSHRGASQRHIDRLPVSTVQVKFKISM
jgi:hypothetical protein